MNPKNGVGISIFYQFLNNKDPGNITKNLINHCKKLNTNNINFPPNVKDIDQFEKDNPDMSITIFEYNGFKTVKGEDINYSNDLNCCIDVRDANLEMKLMRILILLHLKVKMKIIIIIKLKKRKCVQLMLEYLHMLAKENIL